jgi:hypothetical protein
MGVGIIDKRTGQVRLFPFDETEAFSMANPQLQVAAGHEAAAALAGIPPDQARGFVLARQGSDWHVFNQSHLNRADAQAHPLRMDPQLFNDIVTALQGAGVPNPVITEPGRRPTKTTMNTDQPQGDFPDVQAAIYRVALALDSFLVNGIPCGVIRRDFFPGFLEKRASTLLTELASLAEHAPDAPAPSQAKVREVLAVLRAKCQQLIDLVTGLESFPTLPLQQLRATVPRIPLLRGECVQLLRELEVCFRTPQPFYPSRPGPSTAAVDEFLASLEQLFEEAWTASRSGAG